MLGVHPRGPTGTTVSWSIPYCGNSQFTWEFDAAGRYDVTFAVDADDAVPESDEGNNSRSVTVEIPEPAVASEPDLTPTDISYDGTPTSGNRVDFDSGIRNRGDADSDGFNIKWFVDGEEVGAYGSHSGVATDTTDMDGNSQFSHTFSDPGSYEVTFTVDVDNHVTESNEGNHSQSVTVTIE